MMSTKNAAEKRILPTPTVPCSTQVIPITSAHNASASPSLLCVSYSPSLSTAASLTESSLLSSAPASAPEDLQTSLTIQHLQKRKHHCLLHHQESLL